MQKMFTMWSVILESAEMFFLGGTGNFFEGAGRIPPPPRKKRRLDKTVNCTKMHLAAGIHLDMLEELTVPPQLNFF